MYSLAIHFLSKAISHIHIVSQVKEVIMKSTIKKVAMLGLFAGMSQSVMAIEASDTMQWVGSIPASPITGTYEIFNKGTVGFTEGTILFTEVAGSGYEISDSSSIAFGVRETAGTGAEVTSFEYGVQALQFSAGGGLMQNVDPTTPEFQVTANGTALDVGTLVASSGTAGDTITLQLSTPSPIAAVSAGDEVVVRSVVMVDAVTL